MKYKIQMLRGIQRTVDEDALTIYDIVTETGRTLHWASDYANAMVKRGKWEQVWKHGPTRMQKAYRPLRRRAT